MAETDKARRPTLTAEDIAIAEDVIGAWCIIGDKRRKRELIAEGAARARQAAEERVKELEAALGKIIGLDHHNHGPESQATIVARRALKKEAPDNG